MNTISWNLQQVNTLDTVTKDIEDTTEPINNDEDQPLLPKPDHSDCNRGCCQFRICNSTPLIWKYSCILFGISVILIPVIIGCLIPFILFIQHDQSPEKMISVAGKVPVHFKPDGFDSSKIASVHITINSTSNGSATVYYSECKHLNVTSNTLEIHQRHHYPDSPSHQEFNYYNDTPLYVLPTTSITFSVSVSTNSSQDECVYIYIFNTSSSFFKFLASSNTTVIEYYKRSKCIFVQTGSFQNTTNVTFQFNKTDYILSGLLVNDSIAVESNVSVQLTQYNVTGFGKVNTHNSTVIHFCHHSPCVKFTGTKYCLLVESFVPLNMRYSSNPVDLSVQDIKTVAPYATGIILGSIAFICVTVIIVVAICKKQNPPSKSSTDPSHPHQDNIYTEQQTRRTGTSAVEVFIHEPEQERNQNIESHDSTSGIERDESEPNKQKEKVSIEESSTLSHTDPQVSAEESSANSQSKVSSDDSSANPPVTVQSQQRPSFKTELYTQLDQTDHTVIYDIESKQQEDNLGDGQLVMNQQDPVNYFDIIKKSSEWEDVHDLLHSKPDSSMLNELVGSQIPAKWELFGVQVGLEQGCLDCLRSDYQDSKVRFIHLFNEWERRKTADFTWVNVIKVLCSDSICEYTLAVTICLKLKTI